MLIYTSRTSSLNQVVEFGRKVATFRCYPSTKLNMKMKFKFDPENMTLEIEFQLPKGEQNPIPAQMIQQMFDRNASISVGESPTKDGGCDCKYTFKLRTEG